MAKVAVIGAGSWGTALAKVLHTNGSQVTVWSIVEAEIAMLRERHEHVDKLPGVKLPEDMEFTTDLKAAVEDKEYLILAVPSVFTRSTAKSMAPFVKAGQIIVCVAKGIEENTLMTLSDIVEEEVPCGGGCRDVRTEPRRGGWRRTADDCCCRSKEAQGGRGRAGYFHE